MILRNSLVLLCRGVWWAGGGLKALLWKVFFLLNEVTNKPDRKKHGHQTGVHPGGREEGGDVQGGEGEDPLQGRGGGGHQQY